MNRLGHIIVGGIFACSGYIVIRAAEQPVMTSLQQAATAVAIQMVDSGDIHDQKKKMEDLMRSMLLAGLLPEAPGTLGDEYPFDDDENAARRANRDRRRRQEDQRRRRSRDQRQRNNDSKRTQNRYRRRVERTEDELV